MKNNMNYFSNKSSNWIIILLVLLNLALLTFIIIQNKNSIATSKIQEIKKERVRQFIHKELNLSTEQQELFEESGHIYFEKMKNNKMKMTEIKKEIINEMFKKNGPDKEKVDVLMQELSDKHKEIEESQFDHFNELKEICTPEQEQKLHEILNEMTTMMHDRHYHRKMNREGRKYRNQRQ